MNNNNNFQNEKISPSEYSRNFFEAIKCGKINDLKKILRDPNTKPWEYFEDDDYSGKKIKKSKKTKKFYSKTNKIPGLHRAVFMDNTKLIEILLDEMKKRLGIDGKNLMEKWINLKSKTQGFTALHYAAYRGNIITIKKLIENKADYEIINKRGINAIHMACQGNKPNSLVYLKEKYLMDIESVDELLSTPLHWACYNGAEDCIMYLLSWNVSLNLQDKEGLTPLHLAVLSGIYFISIFYLLLKFRFFLFSLIKIIF